MKNNFFYEGKQSSIRDLKTPELETFTNIYKGNDYTIDFYDSRIHGNLPKTGLPDLELSY